MNSKEWVLKNCKFAAWYDPRTWNKKTDPISKDKWEKAQFETPEESIETDWERSQFETPEDMMSEEQKASKEITEQLPELLPSILQHLEAVKVILQRYGFQRYEKSLNDIINIVENVEKMNPKVKSDPNYLEERDRRTMVNRGLLPEIPKIAQKIMALRRALQKDNIKEADLKLAMVQKAFKAA